nr:unnamed protein product [Callosobruchus analis]
MVITRDIRDEIKISVSSTINSVLKSDEFLDQLIQKVTENVIKTLEARFAELEKKLHDNSSVIMELKEETGLLRYENECLSQKYDDLEQAGRVNNLRIFKVKEKPQEKLVDEVINIIKSHLGVNVEHKDILLCTRIGKMEKARPRGILLKLTSILKKQEIFNKKKNLKGSGIVLKEDLTDHRLKLMEEAVEKTSLKSVWSYNGRVYVMKDSKKINIRNRKDLDKL